jgi:peptidyl-prolyl cis-trans isomerase A (cyclophilin A)
VFGKVIDGMEVVDQIATVPTRTAGPHENVPVTPIVIKSAKVEGAAAAARPAAPSARPASPAAKPSPKAASPRPKATPTPRP